MRVVPARLTHVAINADDLEKSLAFYEAVFGWTFTETYPGFFRMESAHTIQIVAVQQRRDLLPSGPTTGLEATIAVEDLQAVISAAVSHGGTVLAAPATIPGVGELVWLSDPGGNVIGAMRYDT